MSRAAVSMHEARTGRSIAASVLPGWSRTTKSVSDRQMLPMPDTTCWSSRRSPISVSPGPEAARSSTPPTSRGSASTSGPRPESHGCTRSERAAGRFLPRQAQAYLNEHEINLEGLVEGITSTDDTGTLLEISDGGGDDQVRIAIE